MAGQVTPSQESMVSGGGPNDEEPPPDDTKKVLSGAAQASNLATLGYACIAAGHVWLLKVHAEATAADGQLFTTLAVVEVALAFEAAVFALGGLGRPLNLAVLTFAGRLRLLSAAVAWPWLVPWGAELSCRCGALSPSIGAGVLRHSIGGAVLIGAFYALREVSFMVRGEPTSALGTSESQIGDCLPSQAVLGGQFRLDKADLEETGRVVFVPARPRQGLYVGAGLAMLAGLTLGAAMALVNSFPPWLLLGALGALLGRWYGQLPKFKGRGEEGAAAMAYTDSALMWRREGPRLICRFGELFWIFCCIEELHRCEAMPSWRSVC
mmetsp:Transcript_111683/g.222007  ORF Transcript_111683/g.222007 Transcript_111683/m.222007 type:complete len:324 (+) Transcript_111683:45-1016(+)